VIISVIEGSCVDCWIKYNSKHDKPLVKRMITWLSGCGCLFKIGNKIVNWSKE